MYFSQEPKTRREDFFDMENALESFQRYVKMSKLVLVTGLRRYGKTSLILTGLNEMNERYIFLDCRLLPSGMISMGDLLNLISNELRRKRSTFRKALERIEEIRLLGAGVKVRRSYETLLEIFESLEGAVLVLDEAQELRRSRHRFDRLLAYAYDHLDMRIVVSGSQVGMLHRFLRIEDPEAPLFGRPYTEVKVPRLPRELSMKFLREGFAQYSMHPREDVLEEVVDSFDGVIGWLSYFGYLAVMEKRVDRGTVSKVLERATRLALSEFRHAVRGERYEEVMRIASILERARWSDIKRGIQARLGKIPDKSLAKLLENLLNMGFLLKVEGYYEISDPVLKEAFRRLK